MADKTGKWVVITGHWLLFAALEYYHKHRYNF